MMQEPTQPKVLDSSVLEGLRVYAKSGAFLQQVIEIFEQHGKASLEELYAASESDDNESVRRVAHRLKGSCLNVGATQMAQKLRHLEQLCAANATRDDTHVLIAELPDVFADTCNALKSIP
ncbi:Hpt domain-containing protein [Oligoflexus tunisiensis]|uniref:Hpt domain-containing protein n=1 Tax=Oligoflexus tunisiensis TaxID=708132 RepID=UPI00114CB7C0|nr:Hpt domain-containing protein [Oligoflexus tunisiensis]